MEEERNEREGGKNPNFPQTSSREGDKVKHWMGYVGKERTGHHRAPRLPALYLGDIGGMNL